MACVTLKRPLDHFEPLLHTVSPAHPTMGSLGGRGGQPPSKRRRCVPFNRHRDNSSDRLDGCSSSCSFSTSNPSSSLVFRETPLSPADIANNLRDELKRLRKRRQVAPNTSLSRHNDASAPSSPEPMMDDATALRTALAAASSVKNGGFAAIAAGEGNKPIFTLRQMTLICERMCKERTDQVREEYDRILHQKLSEQYDAFVKFIDHQIQQRFNESQLPSYLS